MEGEEGERGRERGKKRGRGEEEEWGRGNDYQ